MSLSIVFGALALVLVAVMLFAPLGPAALATIAVIASLVAIVYSFVAVHLANSAKR